MQRQHVLALKWHRSVSYCTTELFNAVLLMITILSHLMLFDVFVLCINNPPAIFSQQKQIQALNKLCSNLLEKLINPRDDRDAESGSMLHFY